MLPARMPPTILLLVRHGETRANLDGVWHGSTDTALTKRGQLQAERAAEHLSQHHAGARALYTSPLQRARQTAAPIGRALGLELQADPELAEFDLGSWEGKSYRELARTHQLWEKMRRDPDFAPHGGESPRQVTDRVCRALARIHAAHPGERVIVVTHGGALSMAMGRLLGQHETDWHRVMDNGALSELLLAPEPSLRSFNFSEHLEGL